MTPRVLIVDDEARMAEVVGMVLRRDGFDVETFTLGSEALARHEEDPFDLVLTDMRMPGLDGLDILRRVRELSTETPVIP